MADATWSLLRDLEIQTRHGSKKPCWSRSLKGLGTEDRLGLEGLLLTYVSQLIVQWIDFCFEGGGEQCYLDCCYLVFASFFPTLLYSILLLCCFVYGLEQCVCLSTRIYTIPHLVLSQCKIYRAITFNWGSKQLLYFQYIFEFSKNTKINLQVNQNTNKQFTNLDNNENLQTNPNYQQTNNISGL